MNTPLAHDAQYWIDHLGLVPHPEGGFYRETYRSEELVDAAALPDRFDGSRSYSTAIYFLLRGHEYSALHRIASDELWHFCTGTPLTIHTIDSAARYGRIHLGSDPEQGQVFQAVVSAGTWFGAIVDDPDAYALVGCTVAPGFDFADFQLASRSALVTQYPQHRAVIQRLTRE